MSQTCGMCSGCRTPRWCGKCVYCKDHVSLGGPGYYGNQVCIYHQCLALLEEALTAERKRLKASGSVYPSPSCGVCSACLNEPQCGICAICIDQVFFGGLYLRTKGCRAIKCLQPGSGAAQEPQPSTAQESAKQKVEPSKTERNTKRKRQREASSDSSDEEVVIRPKARTSAHSSRDSQPAPQRSPVKRAGRASELTSVLTDAQKWDRIAWALDLDGDTEPWPVPAKPQDFELVIDDIPTTTVKNVKNNEEEDTDPVVPVLSSSAELLHNGSIKIAVLPHGMCRG